MKIVAISPSLGNHAYYAIEVTIAGLPCVFRTSDRTYSRMARLVTGEDVPQHDDPRIFQALNSLLEDVGI